MEKVIKAWEPKYSTLIGNITIIKSLTLSKKAYILLPLLLPVKDFLGRDEMLNNFNRAKNSISIDQKTWKQQFLGGLQLTNFHTLC